MGCGVGDLASKLTARGARVVGFDSSEELIEPARSRGIPNAEFRIADLSEDLCFDDSLDGARPVDGAADAIAEGPEPPGPVCRQKSG